MTQVTRCSCIVLALIFCCRLADAAERGCTDAEVQRALDTVDGLHTWDALYKSYRSYRQCDDGAIAEGYSESVAHILASRWDTLPRRADLTSKDAEFRRFVLRHVDATDNPGDLEKIRTKAKTACPSRLRKLCDELSDAAHTALGNQKKALD